MDKAGDRPAMWCAFSARKKANGGLRAPVTGEGKEAKEKNMIRPCGQARRSRQGSVATSEP